MRRKKLLRCLTSVLALTVPLLLKATTSLSFDNTLFEKKLFIHNGDTMPYRILLPPKYDPRKKYPLVVFLHGRGERGRDNEKQLIYCKSFFMADSNRAAFPAIVVFPQCSAHGYWSNVFIENDTVTNKKRFFHFKPDSLPTRDMRLLMELINYIPTQYKIKKSNVSVLGYSMGGMGTLELVRRMPATFKRAVAICGGAHPATAKKMKNTRIWLLHGLKDEVVPADFTLKMAEALKAANAKVEVTLFPTTGHNAWEPTFRHPGLLPWLFGKTGNTGVPNL